MQHILHPFTRIWNAECAPRYIDRYNSGFYTESHGEGMSLVHQSLFGWWKPRFLMDHRSEEAFEFMNLDECFVNFSETDVDLKSLKGLSDELLERAKRGYAGFPTHIGPFKGGRAEVAWGIKGQTWLNRASLWNIPVNCLFLSL